MWMIVFEARAAFKRLLSEPKYTLFVVLCIALTVSSSALLAVQVYSTQYAKLAGEGNSRIFNLQLPSFGQAFDTHEYLHYKENQDHFEQFTAYSNHRFSLVGSEGNDFRADAYGVTVRPEFFDVFEGSPLLGRLINETDIAPGAPQAAVISHRLWSNFYHKAPDVVGDVVMIDRRPTRILGVMPEDYRYPYNDDIWVSVDGAAGTSPGQGESLIIVGSTDNTRNLPAAKEHLNALRSRLSEARPNVYSPAEIDLVTPTASALQGQGTSAVIAMMGSVSALILIIGGACILSITALRYTRQSNEWTVRTIMGYGPGQILILPIIEAAILFTLGLLMAVVLYTVMMAFGSEYTYINQSTRPAVWWSMSIDRTLIGLFLLYSLFLAAASCLVPYSTARLFYSKWRGGSGIGKSKGRKFQSIQKLYLFVQIGLTVMLVSYAAISLSAYRDAINNPTGLDDRNVFIAELGTREMMMEQSRPHNEIVDDANAILDRVLRLPGVQSASMGSTVPTQSRISASEFVTLDGLRVSSDDIGLLNKLTVEASFFDVLGIDLLEGRGFLDSDDRQSEEVVIMDLKTKKALFGEDSALGKQLRLGRDDFATEARVVGVSSNLYWGQDYGDRILFTPSGQSFHLASDPVLFIRTDGSYDFTYEDVASMINSVNADIAINSFSSLTHFLTKRGRSSLHLLFNFLPAVGLAFLMASIAIFIMQEDVVLRDKREIGIKKALGMSTGKITAHYVVPNVALIFVSALAGSITFFFASLEFSDVLMGSANSTLLAISFFSAFLVSALCLVALYVPVKKAVDSSDLSRLMKAE